MSKASEYAARVKAAKEVPPSFGPTGNLGDLTKGEPCRAWVVETGEARIDGYVDARAAKRLIEWLKETFDV